MHHFIVCWRKKGIEKDIDVLFLKNKLSEQRSMGEDYQAPIRK